MGASLPRGLLVLTQGDTQGWWFAPQPVQTCPQCTWLIVKFVPTLLRTSHDSWDIISCQRCSGCCPHRGQYRQQSSQVPQNVPWVSQRVTTREHLRDRMRWAAVTGGSGEAAGVQADASGMPREIAAGETGGNSAAASSATGAAALLAADVAPAELPAEIREDNDFRDEVDDQRSQSALHKRKLLESLLGATPE